MMDDAHTQMRDDVISGLLVAAGCREPPEMQTTTRALPTNGDYPQQWEGPGGRCACVSLTILASSVLAGQSTHEVRELRSTPSTNHYSK